MQNCLSMVTKLTNFVVQNRINMWLSAYGVYVCMSPHFAVWHFYISWEYMNAIGRPLVWVRTSCSLNDRPSQAKM